MNYLEVLLRQLVIHFGVMWQAFKLRAGTFLTDHMLWLLFAVIVAAMILGAWRLSK